MKDLSDLPKAGAAVGYPPETEPYYAARLAAAWAATLDDGSKAMADTRARMRHSDAGKCARQLGYKLSGVPEDRPMDLAGRWITGLGTLVHEKWQDVMLKAFPNAEAEVICFIEECNSAGHIDLVIKDHDFFESDAQRPQGEFVTALELKTINGYGFKMAVGARGAAEGPRTSATMQAALNGHAVGADEIAVVLLAMENMSTREVEKLTKDPQPWQKFAAEWRMDAKEFEPIAAAEILRFKAIQDSVDAGHLPPRSIPVDLPKGARIVDPSKGTWTVVQNGMIMDSGSTWMCGYCPYQPTCVADV